MFSQALAANLKFLEKGVVGPVCLLTAIDVRGGHGPLGKMDLVSGLSRLEGDTQETRSRKCHILVKVVYFMQMFSSADVLTDALCFFQHRASKSSNML